MAHLRNYSNKGVIATRSGAAVAALRARAVEWDIPIVEEPDRLSVFVWGCELRLTVESDRLCLDLSGPEKRMMDTLCDTATELFAEVGLSVDWDHVDVGALAPGLSLMRVEKITQPSPGFIRVRLSGPEAGRFGVGNLHFRLLLPAAGRQPVWPRVSENGRVVWPDGEDTLHRPVYTTAAQSADWLDFDIYRHDGSPTCDWALSASVGQQVGIIGPGGGWCPDAERLWLFGDETALPAISRILDMTRGQARAFVLCAPEDMGDLAQDERVSRCDDLLEALQSQASYQQSDYIWFAGHAGQARSARQHLLSQGMNKNNFLVAAYWT